MAIQILLFAGTIDGDLALDPNHDAFYGGMPAKMTATGLNLCKAPADYIGLFKNDGTEDNQSGPQVQDALAPGFVSAGVVMGANKVEVVQSADAQIFTFANTFAVNDEVYILNTGLLSNSPQAPGDASIGKVVKAPASATDSMHFYQYPTALVKA